MVLKERLESRKLTKKVNVVFVSDHGMVKTVPRKDFIDLDNILKSDTYTAYGSSPVLQIVPVQGHHQYVMTSLTAAASKHGHFKVYDKHTVPDRWRMEQNDRFGPIIVVADLSYVFKKDMEKFSNWIQKDFGVPGK